MEGFAFKVTHAVGLSWAPVESTKASAMKSETSQAGVVRCQRRRLNARRTNRTKTRVMQRILSEESYPHEWFDNDILTVQRSLHKQASVVN